MEPENQPPPLPQVVPPTVPAGPPTPEPSRPGSAKARRTLVVAGLILSLLLVGGGAAAFVLMRGSDELLLNKIPAGTDVVVVASLDPSAGQKLNLMRMEGRFPAFGASQKVGQTVNRTLDTMLQGVGLDHKDVAWVGPEVALTLDFNASGPPSAGVLLTSSDESAAEASLQKLRGTPASQLLRWSTEEHGGIQVSIGSSPLPGTSVSYAIVDGVVVIGSGKQVVEGVIDTSQGKTPALGASADFQQTMADLPTSRLGFAYVNPGAMLGLLKQDAAFQAATGAALGDLKAVKGIGATLSAEPDGLAVDTSIRYDPAQLSPQTRALLSAPSHPNPLLKMVPGNAYGVFAQEHFDMTLKSITDQMAAQGGGRGPELAAPGLSDLLAVLSGDVAVEASPGASGHLGGALLLGTRDEAGMRSSLDSLAAFIPGVLGGGGSSWKTEQYKGVTIRYLNAGGGTSGSEPAPAFAVFDGAGVVASSVDDLEAIVDASKGGATIASAPGFVSATGGVPQGGSLFYLDVHRLIGDIGATLPPGARNSFDQGPGQNLKPIQSIVWGSGGDAGQQRSRLFIRIP